MASAAATEATTARQAAHKAFNKGVKAFLKDLRRMFPHLSELRMLLLAYKVTKAISPSMPHKYFREELLAQHEARLLARDFEFFMSDAFQVPSADYAVAMMKRECRALPAETIELIWQNMANLVALSRRCVEASPST